MNQSLPNLVSASSSQKSIFSAGEADAWLERNRRGLERFNPETDPVIRHVRPHLTTGMTIAEVGCSLAERVEALAKMAGGEGWGIDPSTKAVAEAAQKHPNLRLAAATAERLPWETQSVDVLIYGFCLYLCDRADLFRIAAEGDRVLKENGVLVVLDFQPPFPYRNQYAHRTRVFSYKMDHAELWTWNPAYVEIAREIFDHGGGVVSAASTFHPDERIGVSVLKKIPAFSHSDAPRYEPE